MSTNFQQNLKKNELADTMESALYWIQNNRQSFFSILGVTVGVILFAAFFFSRFYLVQSRVTDRLSVAESYIYAGQKEQGINLLNDLINQYPTSPAAYKARLHKADNLVSQSKFDEAVALAREVTVNGKPEIIQPLAYTHLGNIQETMQDLKGAVATYNEFLNKYPMHFLTPKVLESLARIYEMNNQPKEAQETYQRLTTAYKGTKWEQSAAERLFILSNPQYSAGKK
jgi:TolA-binding protein